MTLTDLSQLLLNQEEWEELQALLSALHERDGETYHDLGEVLAKIATIYSQEDYVDFLGEGFSIQDDLLLLGYLSLHGKCLEASEYDDDLLANIADFVHEQSHINLEVDMWFDEDDLSGFLHYLQETLAPYHEILLLFACDDYYENQLFVFVLPKNLLPEATIDSSLFEPIAS